MEGGREGREIKKQIDLLCPPPNHLEICVEYNVRFPFHHTSYKA